MRSRCGGGGTSGGPRRRRRRLCTARFVHDRACISVLLDGWMQLRARACKHLAHRWRVRWPLCRSVHTPALPPLRRVLAGGGRCGRARTTPTSASRPASSWPQPSCPRCPPHTKCRMSCGMRVSATRCALGGGAVEMGWQGTSCTRPLQLGGRACRPGAPWQSSRRAAATALQHRDLRPLFLTCDPCDPSPAPSSPAPPPFQLNSEVDTIPAWAAVFGPLMMLALTVAVGEFVASRRQHASATDALATAIYFFLDGVQVRRGIRLVVIEPGPGTVPPGPLT